MADLTGALEAIRAFVRDRAWEPFHDPKNLAMAVASEAGELVAELRWVASERADEATREPETHARLTDEAADVAITLLMFCDRAGIDLAAAIPRKLDKNALRYPILMPDEAPDLLLLPWAARRALDLAGRKVSLQAWQALPLEVRRRLAGLGSVAAVDLDAVRALVEGEAIGETIEAFVPPPGAPPGLDAPGWATLSLVAQHALHAYAARGKADRMRELYDAVMSSGESQSTK
ncbi:MAG: hypothetical protein H6719_32230 [Sandaracinaceae bacterium]|nr:hypothetical protein [Sandaracinaceae bacterium]